MLNLGLEGFVPLALYVGGVIAFILSIVWKPIIGIYYFVPLIPLQTIRYRIIDFPLGASLVYVILLGVAIGLIIRGKGIIPKSPWRAVLCIYFAFTFVSLCLGSFYLGSELPWWAGDRRFPDWCDYVTMPATFFLVMAAIPDVRHVKAILLLMCISVLMLDKSFWNTVSGHDFSTYSEDLREGGTMGYAGSNGLAAFEAQFSTLLVALASVEKRWRLKLAYYALAAFGAICLMYSLSRAGYVAIIAGMLFLGIVNERKLLIASGIFAATWASIVPQAVVTRVTMTYDESGALDHSAETRVTLWQDALEIVGPNILIGTGFDTYRYMKRVGSYEDTHNIYLKLLVETGIVGVALFLWILLKSIWRGLSLFRHSKDPTAAGLGLGLAGWVVCAAAANAFGDRWTYLQIQGYFWVLAAFVAYYSRLALESPEGEQAESGDSRKTEALFLIPSSQIVPGAGCRRSL